MSRTKANAHSSTVQLTFSTSLSGSFSSYIFIIYLLWISYKVHTFRMLFFYGKHDYITSTSTQVIVTWFHKTLSLATTLCLVNIFQHVGKPAIIACRNCSTLHAMIAHETTVLAWLHVCNTMIIHSRRSAAGRIREYIPHRIVFATSRKDNRCQRCSRGYRK